MDGIILIDKPAGMTSRDVVDKIAKIFKTNKVGHTGTLDPMATGVLVICIGKATKISELITSYDKEYIAEITLGIETDTLDIEGNTLSEVNDIHITRKQVENVLSEFVGRSKQQVPIYSAIKINGKKLYDYARNNIDVELPVREVEIHNINLVSDLMMKENKTTFKIKCKVSKGTYIRSLVRDIANKLGTVGCMSSLRRVKQGEYSINDCYSLEDVTNGEYQIKPIKDALLDIPNIVVDKDVEARIKNGAIIDKFFEGDKIVVLNLNNEVISIYQTYEKDSSKAKPYKMFL